MFRAVAVVENLISGGSSWVESSERSGNSRCCQTLIEQHRRKPRGEGAYEMRMPGTRVSDSRRKKSQFGCQFLGGNSYESRENDARVTPFLARITLPQAVVVSQRVAREKDESVGHGGKANECHARRGRRRLREAAEKTLGTLAHLFRPY